MEGNIFVSTLLVCYQKKEEAYSIVSMAQARTQEPVSSQQFVNQLHINTTCNIRPFLISWNSRACIFLPPRPPLPSLEYSQ